MKEHAWMVMDHEDGIVLVTDNHKKALKEYEKLSTKNREYTDKYNEFYGNEYVVLAKIERQIYPLTNDENLYAWEEYVDEESKEVESVLVDIMSTFRPRLKNLKLDEEQKDALIKVANLYERLTGEDSFRINTQSK